MLLNLVTVRSVLTDRQRDILAGKSGVSNSYLRKVHCEARKKAVKAIEDLAFLAENCPKDIDYLLADNYPNTIDNLINFVKAILKHDKIEMAERERTRIPIRDLETGKVKSRIRPPWKGSVAQIAGLLRKKDGSLLKKPKIHRKIRISYELLRVIHERLGDLLKTRDEIRKKEFTFPLKAQVIELKKSENEDFKLKIGTFSAWLERFLNVIFDHRLYEAMNKAARDVKIIVIYP